MVFSEAKAWLVTNLAVILGVALVLIGLYAAWLHYVMVPRLESKAEAAEAVGRVHEANSRTCQAANLAMQGAVDRQTASIKALADAGALNQAEVAALLARLSTGLGGATAALRAFRPDPSKSDCANAVEELRLFKIERGR